MPVAERLQFTPAKFFCAVLLTPLVPADLVYNKLSENLGRVDLMSTAIPFTYTDYYSSQMGSSLERRFVAFQPLRCPSELPAVKIFTNKLEGEISEGFPLTRAVNLDPGYVTEASMVLASAKPFSHRLALAEGIYGQLEYLFSRREIRFLDWTFPEYRTDRVKSFFLELRKMYREQLRSDG